jgi:hypothetical protein
MSTQTRRRSAKTAMSILVPHGTTGRSIKQVSAKTIKLAEAFDKRAAAQAPFNKDAHDIAAQAVDEGVIATDMVEHVVALWEANPKAAEEFLIAMGMKTTEVSGTKTLDGGLTFAQKEAATQRRIDSYVSIEAMLDQAVHAGVIDGSLREHYCQLAAADPAGTRAHLNNLGLSMMGVRQTGSTTASANAEAYDSSHLTAAERGRIDAARGKRVASCIVHGG